MHQIKPFARQLLSQLVFVAFLLGVMSLNAQPYALVIHGGSGNIDPQTVSDERKQAYLEKMAEALKVGEEMLKNGEASLDVVEAVVKILEDSPLFNAGKGAVFNIEGKNELDASIMCGATHNAGSVAGLSTIKNPVSAARKVMEESPHVMLTGKSADAFAYEHGLEMVDPGYFFDQIRWDQYREYVRNSFNRERGQANPAEGDLKMGTVGAVALDMQGNLAAATSTGGMTGKYPGRVGDSPLIGAGNYASNLSCGVSATGHGEFFIRNMVAYDIAARVLYKGQSLADAASEVINGKLKEQQANGGIIAIDKDGNVVMEFNTTAMFRGYISSRGEKGVWIFREE